MNLLINVQAYSDYYLYIYFIIIFFIFGTVLGSFFNVVGYRLPKGESISTPPSQCPKCNHRLKPIELIPIFSFLIQKGKCRSCGSKISGFYPFFEFLTGVFFSLSYIKFGISIDLLIAITFISMLMIIIISDYLYFIIPDEVLIFFGILLAIQIFIKGGIFSLGWAILDGIIALLIMLLLKKLGDFLFKKESMGGGDIKLLFIFGLLFEWENALLIIFLGSIIGLPVSLIIVKKERGHIIPFGPFLSAGALLMLFTHIDINTIIKFLYKG